MVRTGCNSQWSPNGPSSRSGSPRGNSGRLLPEEFLAAVSRGASADQRSLRCPGTAGRRWEKRFSIRLKCFQGPDNLRPILQMGGSGGGGTSTTSNATDLSRTLTQQGYPGARVRGRIVSVSQIRSGNWIEGLRLDLHRFFGQRRGCKWARATPDAFALLAQKAKRKTARYYSLTRMALS